MSAKRKNWPSRIVADPANRVQAGGLTLGPIHSPTAPVVSVSIRISADGRERVTGVRVIPGAMGATEDAT